MQDHTHPESDDPESVGRSAEVGPNGPPANNASASEAGPSNGDGPVRSDSGGDEPPTASDSDQGADTDRSAEADQSPLETLRHVVERRLNSVIEVEKQVRADVERLNARLMPVFKTFDRLAPVLALKEPSIAAVLTTARDEVASHVSQIESMQTAVAQELHFRDQFSEAALGRWQSYRRLTADPLNDWSRQGGEQHARTQQLTTQLQMQVEQHEQRWSTSVVPEPRGDSRVTEPADSEREDSRLEKSGGEASRHDDSGSEDNSSDSTSSSPPLIPDEN